VKIILLGTGGYHPSEQRHTACLLVPEWGLMFDAGTATFRVAPRLATRELDIFLTHAHLDHIVGLTYLLAPLVLKEVDAVRVHAAPAVLEAVRTHLFADPVFSRLKVRHSLFAMESSFAGSRWRVIPAPRWPIGSTGPGRMDRPAQWPM
jgi:ribonuclease BN (tRNA processing enzyme)